MALLYMVATVPHEEQRYPTVGDWTTSENSISRILVSDMKNPDYEFLVAIHEQIEAYLCLKRGISDAAVTAFDQHYEAVRPSDDVSEPGDDPESPYYREHQFATMIEKVLAEEIGVEWEAYDEKVSSL